MRRAFFCLSLGVSAWLFIGVSALFLGCDGETLEGEDDGGIAEDTSLEGHNELPSDDGPPDEDDGQPDVVEEDTEVADTLEPLPEFELGEPLPKQKLWDWKFINVKGAKCRKGSDAGFFLKKSGKTDNLLVFFGFGGACFNPQMCALTATAEIDLAQTPRNFGVFDHKNKENPVKDYNMVYIPYCTGDVHAGSRKNVKVDGVLGTHDFVGGDNYRLFLRRIAATFPDAETVVLTGYSAGGFGATFNLAVTQNAFGRDTSIVILSDGAPPLRDEYLPPCLMKQLRDYWDLDEYLSEICEGCMDDDGSGIFRIMEKIKARAPGVHYGLISSYEDFIIRMFFSYGLNNCEGVFRRDYPGPMYKKAVLDFRDYLDSLEWGGTFYFKGSEHGKILLPMFYTEKVNGVRLVDWFRDLMEGNMYHVRPDDE